MSIRTDFLPATIELKGKRTPRTVLHDLANEIAEKTDRVLLGRVFQSNLNRENPVGENIEGIVAFTFEIVAPYLEHYSVRLFNIRYNLINGYPIEYLPYQNPSKNNIETKVIKSEEEFSEYLKEVMIVFQNIIESLYAQSVEPDVTPDRETN